MSRDEIYDFRRNERKLNFLYGIRTVRYYFLRKYGLEQGDFELICDLHAIKTFRREDFENGIITLTWDRKRWQRMLQDEWIYVYRERKPSEGRNYKIFKITKKAHNMIERFYRILCGEEPIPENTIVNPVMKKESYQDKRYAAAIQAFNAARQKLD